MTKKNNKQIDIYNDDIGKLLKNKTAKKPDVKRFTMILPSGLYENITKVALSEGYKKPMQYIRDKLIVPKFEEIAAEIEAEYNENNNPDSDN